MEKFKRHHITRYQMAVLYAFQKKIEYMTPGLESFPACLVIDAIRSMREGKAPFSFPDLIYKVDSLIVLCDYLKNNLIDIKKWLEMKWNIEEEEGTEVGEEDQ